MRNQKQCSKMCNSPFFLLLSLAVARTTVAFSDANLVWRAAISSCGEISVRPTDSRVRLTSFWVICVRSLLNSATLSGHCVIPRPAAHICLSPLRGR